MNQNLNYDIILIVLNNVTEFFIDQIYSLTLEGQWGKLYPM